MASVVGDEIKHVLLTGRPGIGKTTLIKKVCDKLKVKGIGAKGFFTEEVCENGRRIGFDIVALDGRRGELARIRGKQTERSHPEYCVGQYIVNVMSFEAVALPVFSNVGQPGHVLVVDEIGKMELFSKKFKDCVSTAFSSPKTTILGTIPVAKQHPIQFVEELRKRPAVKVITVCLLVRTREIPPRCETRCHLRTVAQHFRAAAIVQLLHPPGLDERCAFGNAIDRLITTTEMDLKMKYLRC